jgi:hypothetical protein
MAMAGPAAIDARLEDARRSIDRVQPADLASEMAAGALVIDTRPVDQRQRDGELPGALIIDRNVLEWRLDPTCPHHIPQAANANVRIVIVQRGLQLKPGGRNAAPTRPEACHRSRWRVPGMEATRRSGWRCRGDRRARRLSLACQGPQPGLNESAALSS